MPPQVDVIILAAGRGSRMRTSAAKALLPMAGKALLHYVLDAVAGLRPRRVVIVIPSAADNAAAANALRQVQHPKLPRLIFAEQQKPRGTADAAECALQKLSGANGAALIICADSPLITTMTLRKICTAANKKTLTLLSADISQPRGYGRIVRDSRRAVCGIVEERDADMQTRNIGEIFGGVLAAPLPWLKQQVPQIKSDNKARERYLTDLAKTAADNGFAVKCVCGKAEEALGINNPADLARAEVFWRRRCAHELMRRGVRLADPLRLDIRGTIRGGADSFVDANVVFSGRVVIGRGCTIGANCVIGDCTIGNNVRIEPFCHLHSATIGRDCVVGPFARIRRQTSLASGAHIGSFVEVKNSNLRENAKAGHLAYIGDASVGRGVNIAAGVITCNYDGNKKHQTIVGDGAFVGSGVELVAPVKIGAGAYIAAGSTITRDAKADALTVARCRQKTRRLPSSARRKTGGKV